MFYLTAHTKEVASKNCNIPVHFETISVIIVMAVLVSKAMSHISRTNYRLYGNYTHVPN